MAFITEDHGLVKPSTGMLSKQNYRAVVKNSRGHPVLMSVATYRNRDITTSIAESARDAAVRLCVDLLGGRSVISEAEQVAHALLAEVGEAKKFSADYWVSGEQMIDHQSVMSLIRKGWITVIGTRANRFGKAPVLVSTAQAESN